MSKKIWTPDLINAKLKEIKPHLVLNPESYINANSKALFIDEVYGEWYGVWSKILKGRDHPARGEIERKKKYVAQQSAIVAKMKATNLERYGTEFQGKRSEVLEKMKQTNLERYGHVCSLSNENVKLSRDATWNEKYGGNPLLTEEGRRKTKETLQKKYGVEHPTQLPDHAEKSFNTKKERGSLRTSEFEREIKAFIEELGFQTTKHRFLHNVRNKFLELDICIDSHMLAIECNGLYWHSEAQVDKYYHIDKTNLAKANGYELIHIFEDEWQTRKQAVKNFLKSKLSIKRRFFARKTYVAEVSSHKAMEFLNEYHIQGSVNCLKTLGLFNTDNELLMIGCVSRHHRNSTELILSRFVTKTDVQVLGGMGKLSKALITEFGPLKTWVDLRFSSGTSYEKSGWIHTHTSNPDYFYTDKKKRISKQARRKSVVGTPRGVTEWEHAKKDGLLKIWDCGKKTFLMS